MLPYLQGIDGGEIIETVHAPTRTDDPGQRIAEAVIGKPALLVRKAQRGRLPHLAVRGSSRERWPVDAQYTRAPMTGHPELNAMARRVINGNHYMTLATLDPTGRPRLSPVFYTAARYRDFYWVSSPDAQHSRNLSERPDVEIVIFDSTAAVGAGEAVYMSATARPIRDDELDRVCAEAFRTTAGARRFQPDELRAPGSLRLYVATATSCEVHVPGGHRSHGRGVDTRQPADPTSS